VQRGKKYRGVKKPTRIRRWPRSRSPEAQKPKPRSRSPEAEAQKPKPRSRSPEAEAQKPNSDGCWRSGVSGAERLKLPLAPSTNRSTSKLCVSRWDPWAAPGCVVCLYLGWSADCGAGITGNVKIHLVDFVGIIPGQPNMVSLGWASGGPPFSHRNHHYIKLVRLP
jgi:hypothetical protein